MKKLLKFRKSDLYHIIIRSAVTSVLSAIIVIGFLKDSRLSYEITVKQRQMVLLQYAKTLVDAQMEEKENVLTQAQKEISQIALAGKWEYTKILSRTCALGDFEAVYYLVDDYVYTDNGNGSVSQYEPQLNRMLESGVDHIHTVRGVWENGDLFLLFPISVKQVTGARGTLLALYDCDKLVNTGIFDELHDQGACYLIENNGDVMFFYPYTALDINVISSNNLYGQMHDLSRGDAASKSLVQTMRHSAGLDSWQSFEIKANNSHNCYITVSRLEGLDGYSLAAVTDMQEQNAFMGHYQNKVLRVVASIFLCSMISLLLIWRYVKKVTEKMAVAAYTDNVTKGKNVNYFRKAAREVLESHTETPYIIQRFDICNFRYLNEAYGHQYADDILRACVEIYAKIYSKNELCVRMHSDQFLTLTINDSNVDERREQYIEALNEYVTNHGINYPIRLKYGVYQLRKQDRDIDVWIDRANAARRSLNGNEVQYVAYYSDAIVRDMLKVDRIESEMQRALETGEFKVFLQAKWDIVNDRVAGAEALVRWIRPDGSMVFPDEFIPVFERNGFIQQLDFYMLESVFKNARKVLDSGGTVYPVSINQSRMLLHNPEYFERIIHLFDEYKIPKQYIELEVTETALFDDRKHMLHVLKELKGEHIKLSMDDFGSGYSSLNTLKDMPFDVLKIDKGFFSEAVTSNSSTLILQKIIEMADGLGMEVICEGVENEQQVDLLRRIGCKRVQGYFYAKPVAAEKFVRSYCQIPEVG